jgi:hypothetical protein
VTASLIPVGMVLMPEWRATRNSAGNGGTKTAPENLLVKGGQVRCGNLAGPRQSGDQHHVFTPSNPTSATAPAERRAETRRANFSVLGKGGGSALLDLARARRLRGTSAARLRADRASEMSGGAISEQLSALHSQKLPEDGNVAVALFKNVFA